MFGHRVARRFGAILLAVTLLGTCGTPATQSPATQSAATQSPTAQPPASQSPTAGGADAFPTGTWVATSDAGDVAVLEYRSDGTWTFTVNGSPVGTGTYSTAGNSLTIVTDSSCKAAGAEQGAYTWTHTNDQLTLKVQTDLCQDRVGVYSGMVWKAVSPGAAIPAAPAISPRVPATTADKVTLHEGTIDWDTYRFELTKDNEIVAGSYDGKTKVQRTFKTWVLENGFLKVTLVPEYGGRIISIVYKPTGHEELYRNPVGVPYQIGTGTFYYNWLMVYGGIFPTFPEPEHGKFWLLPWTFNVIENTDQEVTVAMSIQDDIADPGAPAQFSAGVTGIKATFSVTLRAGRAAVDTAVALERRANGTSPLFEYWTCTTLAPGSDPQSPRATGGAEIVAPAKQLLIDNPWTAIRGQETATTTPEVFAFKNLRLFKNWPDMGIAYAYPNAGGRYWGVINHDNGEGIFRIADNGKTPGLKLWTWGYPQSMAVDPQATNSEIRPYVELWAGVTKRFYEKTSFPGTGELTINETYAPSLGLTNVTHANANFLVNLDASRSAVANVQVFGIVPGETVDVQLTFDGAPVHSGSITLDPHAGNSFSAQLPGGATGGTLQLTIKDQAGTELFTGSSAIGGSGQ